MRSRIGTGMLLCGLLLAGCHSTQPAAPAPGQAAEEAKAGASANKLARAQGCEHLESRHPDAAFLLYFPATGRHVACNPARVERAFLPASTFKIANALIGLETGAVRDEHEVMKWDGRKRAIPAWNQDTDLAAGMFNSTVWFYQAMARRIGAGRMRDGVRRLDYGNRDIGTDEAVDHFWLDGALRISATQQVEFLDRLRRHALPVAERSQSITIRILERDRSKADAGSGWLLRAKSGAAIPIDRAGDVSASAPYDAVGSEAVGWFVGWVERDATHGGDAVFAFNLRLRDGADIALREPLARELLAANGVLPASATASAARSGSTGR